MTRVEYLRGAAILPIAVPIPIAAWMIAAPTLGVATPNWLAEPLMVAFMGGFLFGLPYAVIAGAALLVLRRRSWRAHVILALGAPLVFTACLPVVFLVFGARGVAIWGEWSTFAPYSLGVGYGYVCFALSVMVVLCRARVIA
jgi:hypothetical protein